MKKASNLKSSIQKYVVQGRLWSPDVVLNEKSVEIPGDYVLQDVVVRHEALDLSVG